MALAEGRVRFLGISSTFINTISWVNPLPFERQKLVKLDGRSLLWDLICSSIPSLEIQRGTWFSTCHLQISEIKSILRDACAMREMSFWQQLPAKSQALGTSCWVQTLPLLQTTFHSGSLKITQELQTIPRRFQGLSLPQVNYDPGISGIPQSHSHWNVWVSVSHSWILKGRRPSSLTTFDRAITYLHLKKCYLNLSGFLQNVLQNTLQRNIFFPLSFLIRIFWKVYLLKIRF